MDNANTPTNIEQVAPKLYSTPLASWPKVVSFDEYTAFVLNREAAQASKRAA